MGVLSRVRKEKQQEKVEVEKMEPGQVELSSLLGWLRTFSLQSQAGSALELSDGEAMAEALVKIEPEVFTPSWFAGILQSSKSNKETLNSVLNLLLHYYRHNLGEDCASGELPVPVIPPDCDELSSEMVARFLKLMLGVAVTCSNKQTFIDKIQSLDETTQHALTSCVASFIYTKEWTGRISAQSLNSELKMATPPGDEIWAQKCHELDFQVALLKEERSNLLVENEDLCEKVRAAQTLSRKDSVKARQFETELAHIKDEFERLRLAYESTKEHINGMEARLKPDAGDQTEKVKRLTKETAELRTELAGLKAGLSSGKGEAGVEKWGEAGQVLGSLQEQREAIAELRSMIEYQAGLGREVNCLKDQVDILRESSYSYNRHEQELVEIRSRLSHFQLEGEDIAEMLRGQNQNRTLMSLESETNLSSAGLGADVHANGSFDQNQSLLSQRNNLLEETMVIAEQRSSTLSGNITIHSELQSPRLSDKTIHSELRSPRLTRESIQSKHLNNSSLHFVKTVPEEDEEEAAEEVRQLVEGMKPSLHEELRLLQTSACSSLQSPEQVDSGMDMTTESTPFTSRPESELVLPDGCLEDDVQATPRQLERLLEESNSGSSVSSTSPDSGLQLEDLVQEVYVREQLVQEVYVREQGMGEAEDTVMESRSIIRSTADHVRLLEKEKAALVEEKEQLVRASQELLDQVSNQELLGKVDNQLPFDPNDPKVKELEEWECSVSRSVIVEDYPRNRLAKLFKLKKRSPKLKLRRAPYQTGKTIEEKRLLERRHFDDDEEVSVDCVNSWLLSIFVKVFD